jgi:hypothetical protein
VIPQPENYLALVVIAVIAAALAFAAFHTRLRRYECHLCRGLFRSERKRAAHCLWHHGAEEA